MNVPRPLLVLVMIIIVLGVLSCGAGAVRGLHEDTATPAPMTDGLINGLVSPDEVELTGNCSIIAGPAINVVSTCALTMDPQALRPRKLHLVVASGTVLVTASQQIRGELRSSEPTTRSVGDDVEDDVDVSVAGSSPVVVKLGCLVSPCQLDFSL